MRLLIINVYKELNYRATRRVQMSIGKSRIAIAISERLGMPSYTLPLATVPLVVLSPGPPTALRPPPVARTVAVQAAVGDLGLTLRNEVKFRLVTFRAKLSICRGTGLVQWKLLIMIK
jgi:hypothetical protein